MILGEMFNGRFYLSETGTVDSPRYKKAGKACGGLVGTLSGRLNTEDYELGGELQA